MLRAFQFVLVVLMLSALALVSAVVTMHFAIHGTEVTVPDFKDMTVNEATSEAAQLGLNVDVDAHSYSIDIPAGHVDAQTPRAGTKVRTDWHLRLVESLGPQKVAIPDLVGSDERVAAIQIRRVGLELGQQAEMPDVYAEDGAVIAQTPLPHAPGVERPTVSLLTATAAPQDQGGFVMPNLVGQSYSAAALSVTHAGMNLAPPRTQAARIEQPEASSALPTAATSSGTGTVTAQQPAAGSRVDASTPIQLTVAE